MPSITSTGKVPSLRKRKASQKVQRTTKKAKTTADNGSDAKACTLLHATENASNGRLQSIRYSKEKYKEYLWMDHWEDELVWTEVNDNHLLNANPALSAFGQTVPTGNLTNPLHPLVARENFFLNGFVDDPVLLWSHMEPAMRLVSMFLTVPQVRWAWMPILLGRLEKWQSTGTILRYDEDALMQEAAAQGTLHLWMTQHFERIGQGFSELAGKIKFCFGSFGARDNGSNVGDDGELNQVHGLHHAPDEPFATEFFVKADPAELKGCQGAHRILLSSAYAEFLQRDVADAEQVKPVMLVRVLFNLATTIIHEVSHALYCHIRKDEIARGASLAGKPAWEYDEPHVFTDEKTGEIGCSIERRLFGKSWEVTMHPEKGARMEVSAQPQPGVWDQGEYVEVRTHGYHFVDPTWLYSFFTQARWEEICKTPLQDSRGCCHWPFFKYHLRTKAPSIEEWWHTKRPPKKKGPKANVEPPGIEDFCKFDDWEFFLGGYNKNLRGRPSKEMPREVIEDAVLAVETLDQEYLQFHVEKARKARGTPETSSRASSEPSTEPSFGSSTGSTEPSSATLSEPSCAKYEVL